jgi:hypothetical protein
LLSIRQFSLWWIQFLESSRSGDSRSDQIAIFDWTDGNMHLSVRQREPSQLIDWCVFSQSVSYSLASPSCQMGVSLQLWSDDMGCPAVQMARLAKSPPASIETQHIFDIAALSS